MLNVLFIIVVCILNILATQIQTLCVPIVFFEYTLILVCYLRKKWESIFKLFILFSVSTVEFTSFALGTETAEEGKLYSFIHAPILGPFLFQSILLLLLWHYRSKLKECYYEFDNLSRTLLKYLFILLISGAASSIIAMVLNDNGIMGTPMFPVCIISYLFNYVTLISVFVVAFIICKDQSSRDVFSKYIINIIIGIATSSVIMSLAGFKGYINGTEGAMLSPLFVVFTPFLLCFVRKKDSYSFLYLFISVLIIFVSIFNPPVVGSKWYLVLFLAIICQLVYSFKIKSFKTLIFIGILFLVLVPTISEYLMPYMVTGDINEWKFGQLMGALSIFEYSSPEAWFYSLSPSPQYRIDEILNIAIEYIEKPWFFIFGKGFGGTTLHHTPFLFWEAGNGTFSDNQIKFGIYWAMHESLTVLFLRHGLIGLLFFFKLSWELIKQIPKTPWAAPALIWFVFYWSYGLTLMAGAVFLVLVFMDKKYKIWQE